MYCNRCQNRMTTVKHQQNDGYCEECVRRIGLQMIQREIEQVYILDEIWESEITQQINATLLEPERVIPRGQTAFGPQGTWWNLPMWLQQIALNLGYNQTDYLEIEQYE